MQSKNIKIQSFFFSLIFAFIICGHAFAIHPGPEQWSLAGVASWAQILTASGTAAPTDIIDYTIGDFYAQNTPGSSTVTLYRLCASDTTAVWNLVGSAGGGSGVTNLMDLSDLPSVSGNGLESLILNAGENGFEWRDVTADYNTAIGIAVENHAAVTDSPHGTQMNIGEHYFRNYGNYDRRMVSDPGVTLSFGQAVVASFTESSDDAYPIPAPASSTQVIGFFLYYDTYDGDTCAWVRMGGMSEPLLATASELVEPGDWVITSDVDPGYCIRASVKGDLPLPCDEKQRALGYAVDYGYYDGVATTSWIVLKGVK